VVAAPVEVADQVDENEKVSDAGAESGGATVEKEKSDYIHRSIRSGKGPTVRGFYKESATRSSSSSTSSSSNVSSSVSACCLD